MKNREIFFEKYEELKETIRKECEGGVYYFPNPGNWGDALIRHGTIKFLNDMNLRYEILRPKTSLVGIKQFIRGGTVIYGGGGAWCKAWDKSESIVDQFRKRFKVIVLPSTFENHYVIPNTKFFVRDIYNSKANMPEARFCHDMAFYIGDEMKSNAKGSGKGYFFRTDKESSNKFKIPKNNIDLSQKANHMERIDGFFEQIDYFSAIYTDRLHVSIAGCLLNKEVHLYPGSYFKNESIYLSSMRDFFDNVYFHKAKFVESD